MKDIVKKTLRFENDDRIPLVYFNRDREKSDLLMLDVCRLFQGEGHDASEWGFRWHRLDGTMGQPSGGILSSVEELERLPLPDPCDPARFVAAEAEMRAYPGRYYLASLGLSGFTIMTCLRGFSGVLEDMYVDEELFTRLMDAVFGFEEKLIRELARHGFDGVAFFDDWGTQENLIISPQKWREYFRPRYERQFAAAHESGLEVYFHSCGQIGAIIGDLFDAGVDMLNLSQPNLFDIPALGRRYGGKQCFVCPVSYQTTSLSGTREMIEHDVRELMDALGRGGGGLIGYIEDYRVMGMSEENYRYCVAAFEKYGSYRTGL